MRDLGTMLWKEIAEIAGNPRILRIFGIAVLIMGLLPSLERGRATAKGGPEAAAVLAVLSLIWAMFAGAIAVAQTAPDLVLHERSGRTFEYLLATRLPDAAIFAGKVLVGSILGYLSTLLAVTVQLLAAGLRGGWTWSYLAEPQGRLVVFAGAAAIAVYMSIVGTFVALRVGDQRAAYMVTMLSLGVLALPFLLQIVHLHFTLAWLSGAVAVLAVVDLVLLAIGVRLFKRELLVLYLQD